MATRRYNYETFRAVVNGQEYTFTAYTTNTRSGFCHTVESNDLRLPDTKVSYCNRTWESFRYETALRGMIRKFPVPMQASLTAQLIEKKAVEETEKAEAMLDTFQGLYNGLNDENKARMANYPTLQSEDDARACMAFMGLLTLMQQ